MNELTIGLIGEASEMVTADTLAARWGSGMVPGFATPAMVALMENAAYNATSQLLPPGQTTVGVSVNIKHLAGTPVGMRVRARAELLAVEGRKLVFRVQAWDEAEQIGEGTHERRIVELERFQTRLGEKARAASHSE